MILSVFRIDIHEMIVTDIIVRNVHVYICYVQDHYVDIYFSVTWSPIEDKYIGNIIVGR